MDETVLYFEIIPWKCVENRVIVKPLRLLPQVAGQQLVVSGNKLFKNVVCTVWINYMEDKGKTAGSGLGVAVATENINELLVE